MEMTEREAWRLTLTVQKLEIYNSNILSFVPLPPFRPFCFLCSSLIPMVPPAYKIPFQLALFQRHGLLDLSFSSGQHIHSIVIPTPFDRFP